MVTTSTNAVTELVDPGDKNKGVKVTFNEEVFKDPLESIIATALHESVHARQLKSGVPARSFHYGPRKDYYAAVNALSELEAYTIEALSPFFGKLPLARQKQLKGFLGQAEKKAVAAINKMNIDLSQYHVFQNMLNKLVPKYKGLKAWFKSHPLPWGKRGVGP